MKKNIKKFLTLAVCVLKLDSVANPFPQMLQWNGRFLARSTWASWLRKCCCKLLNWMKARPQSGRWHLYGRSPSLNKNKKKVKFEINSCFLKLFANIFLLLFNPFLLFFKCSFGVFALQSLSRVMRWIFFAIIKVRG